MEKFKINLNPDKITPQDFSKHMNFDKFSSNVPANGNWLTKLLSKPKWKTFAGATCVTALAGYIAYTTLNVEDKSQSPFVNPPLKTADIQYSIYNIDPSRDTTIIYETGSTINIPANAFIDKNDKQVKEPIEIHYREFHNSVDAIIAGIPMEYDSSGKKYDFETAGMFELLPYKNGELLRIDPKKPLLANLISFKKSDSFNNYYLDTVNRKWNYIGKNSVENGGNVILFDSALVAKFQGNKIEQKNSIRPLKANSNRAHFTIDYNKEEFPELALYDDVKFEVDENEKTYDPKLSRKTWEDVYIKRKPGNHYSITFSKGSESHSFNVIPVLEGKDYEQSKKYFDSQMNQYTSLMAGRKVLQGEQEAILRSNYEKYIRNAQWSNVNTNINSYLATHPINFNCLVMRTFSLQNVGIYNSDRPWPFSPENSIAANVNVFDENKKTVQIKRIYMINKTQNTSRADYLTNVNQVMNLRYIPGNNFTLFIISSDGFPGYISGKEFSESAKGSKEFDVTLHMSNKIIDNTEDLKKFFNM